MIYDNEYGCYHSESPWRVDTSSHRTGGETEVVEPIDARVAQSKNCHNLSVSRFLTHVYTNTHIQRQLLKSTRSMYCVLDSHRERQFEGDNWATENAGVTIVAAIHRPVNSTQLVQLGTITIYCGHLSCCSICSTQLSLLWVPSSL